MKTFSFISEFITSALGWTLIHAVWQGFVLVLIAALVLYLLRNRSSYARYWVGIVALFSQLGASLATFVFYYQPILGSPTASKLGVSAHYLASGMAYTQIALPWYKQALLFLQFHLDTIVLFWGIGASVLLIRLVGNWIYVQQLRAEGIRLTEPHVQSLFKRIAEVLQIRQSIHLFESVRVSTPMVVGFIKPVVLLPVGLVTGLTTKQIEAILAHELAHVKRYDYLINLLQSLVEVVYFFHPALWWLSGRIREERENCCDDVAVKICGDKLALAHALAEVASFRQTPALAMAFASPKTALLHRVRRILGVNGQPTTNNGHLGGVLLVALLTLGISVYAIQQEEKPKQAKGKNSTPKTIKSRKATVPEIDYTAIVPSEVELKVMTELELAEAQPKVDAVLAVFSDSLDKSIALHSHKIDSLGRLMQPQHQKMEALRREIEQHEFKVEELERKMEVMEWKRSKFYEERGQLLEKRSRILHQEGQKSKKSEAEVEKELVQFEEQIKQQEAQIQQFNQQTNELRQQIKTVRQPVEEIEKQMKQLEATNERYSEEMNRHSVELHRAFPPPPPPMPRVRAERAPRAVAAPRTAKPVVAPTRPLPPTPPVPPKKKQ